MVRSEVGWFEPEGDHEGAARTFSDEGQDFCTRDWSLDFHHGAAK